MSNRDGMRRLRQDRRAAGFREVTVWVPVAEADAIAMVARAMLVTAAQGGTPLPGDPELVQITAALEREALNDLFHEACAEAGRVVEPWRLGFDHLECVELQGVWSRAAYAEYLRWRDDFLRQDPGADAAKIEDAWQAHLESSDFGTFDVMSSALRRERRQWIAAALAADPHLTESEAREAWAARWPERAQR